MEYFDLVESPKINSPYSSHYTQKLLPNRNKQRSLIQDIDIPLDLAPDYSLPSIYKETYILREVNEMYGERTDLATSDGFSSTSTPTSSTTNGSSASKTNGKRATAAPTASESMSDTSYLTDSRIPNPLTPHVSALQQAMYEQADEDGEFELDYYNDDDDDGEGEEEGDVVLLIDDLTQHTTESSSKASKSQNDHNSDPSSEKSCSNGSGSKGDEDEEEDEYDIDLFKLFSGQQKRAKKTEDRNKSITSSSTSSSSSTTTTSSSTTTTTRSSSAKVTNKQRLSSILVRLADRPVAATATSTTTTSSTGSKGVVSKVGKEKTVESSAK